MQAAPTINEELAKSISDMFAEEGIGCAAKERWHNPTGEYRGSVPSGAYDTYLQIPVYVFDSQHQPLETVARIYRDTVVHTLAEDGIIADRTTRKGLGSAVDDVYDPPDPRDGHIPTPQGIQIQFMTDDQEKIGASIKKAGERYRQEVKKTADALELFRRNGITGLAAHPDGLPVLKFTNSQGMDRAIARKITALKDKGIVDVQIVGSIPYEYVTAMVGIRDIGKLKGELEAKKQGQARG